MSKKEKNEVKIFIKDLEKFAGKFKNENELGKACKRLFDFLMNKPKKGTACTVMCKLCL